MRLTVGFHADLQKSVFLAIHAFSLLQKPKSVGAKELSFCLTNYRHLLILGNYIRNQSNTANLSSNRANPIIQALNRPLWDKIVYSGCTLIMTNPFYHQTHTVIPRSFY